MAAPVQRTASGKIAEGAAKFAGWEIVVGTSAVAISVRDKDASGAIIAVIPASQTAGTRTNLATPIGTFTGQGLYADFSTATGTVNFLVE